MEFGVDPAEWRRVLDLANAGEISLHPDVGNGLDKVCDEFLTQLGDILQLTRGVTFVTGFGPFPSSKALEEKFSLKATGTEQSIDTVLQQHIDTVKMAKEVVAKAISNFVEIDQTRADQLTGVDIPQ
ncbi:hypothetical protein [Nocardia sp. NBC_01009]|uniref:hypothetical protein n=1 Tax=Nocardia sp. NBC_01009 TaxID=2975996 RepID=UPI003869FB48|nr:hypothetical protein OHA42_02780 [Nocardia sp. NBC_01009]